MNCKECGKETNNPKYCSRSCSVKANNRGIRRRGQGQVLKSCLNCGKETNNPKYCDNACQHSFIYKQRLEDWKNGGDVSAKIARRFLLEKRSCCWTCGITEWMGKSIILELEHIDGNSENNAEENLSLLCPNCHSQTSTYKAKNKGNGRHYRRQRYAEGKSF